MTEASSSSFPPSQRKAKSRIADSTEQPVEVIPANAGDHTLIHDLLLAVHQNPSATEFQATNDDPLYEPSDRLLIKRDGRIVSHALLSKRTMKFGDVQLPIAEVQWLATLPEYRSFGYDIRLLEAADEQMRYDGAVAAVLRTTTPELFHPLGWHQAGTQQIVRASTHEVLAQLADPCSQSHPLPLKTRMWRHVELRSLIQLYEANTLASYGPLVRSEVYWRWLITRKAYDQLLVVIEGDDTLDFGEQAPLIVGYAVLRGNCIVEMMAAEHQPAAISQIVARACREMLERDESSIRIVCPAASPTYRSLREAIGSCWEVEQKPSEVLMLKILDWNEYLRRLYSEFYLRAKAAGIDRPCDLTFHIDGKIQQLTLTRRSVKFGDCQQPRADVTCSQEQLQQMVLGLFDWETAQEAGVKIRTKRVASLARQLLCKLPHWRPMCDDLQA